MKFVTFYKTKKMNKSIVCLCLILSFSAIKAQNYNIDFVKSFVGNFDNGGSKIICDQSKNIYVAGYFEGVLNYQSLSISSHGNRDGFVIKLDSLGNVIWGQSFGGNKYDNAHSLVIDSMKNVYVIGKYEGNISIGGQYFYSSNAANNFVAKFDSLGNFVWLKNTSNWSGGGYSDYTIATDSNEAIYLTSFYSSTFSLGDTILQANKFSAGYIAKLDFDGKLIWVNNFGGNNITFKDNYLYVVGYSSDTAYFGTNVYISPKEAVKNVSVTKIHKNGQIIWTHFCHEFGQPIYVQEPSITIDDENSVYITGNFYDTLVTENDTLSSSFSIGGCYDGADYYPDSLCKYFDKDFYLIKYDSSGMVKWSKVFNTKGSDESFDLCFLNKNIVLTGTLSDTLKIDNQFVVANKNDFFIASFYKNGDLNWLAQSSGNDYEYSLSLESSENNLLITGNYTGTLNFENNYSIASNNRSAFIIKLKMNNINTSINNISSQNDFIIYPVPAKNFINIESQNEKKIFSIELFNISGQKVYSKSDCIHKTKIDVGRFNNSIYLLNLSSEGFQTTQKIIIEN